MDIIKGYFFRNDNYWNFLIPGNEENYVEIGQFSRNLRYRSANDINLLF